MGTPSCYIAGILVLMVGCTALQQIHFQQQFPLTYTIKDANGRDAFRAVIQNLKQTRCLKYASNKPVAANNIPELEVTVLQRNIPLVDRTWRPHKPKCSKVKRIKRQLIPVQQRDNNVYVTSTVVSIKWLLRHYMTRSSYLLSLKLKFKEDGFIVGDHNRRCLHIKLSRLVPDPISTRFHFSGLDLKNVSDAVLDVELRPHVNCSHGNGEVVPCYPRKPRFKSVNIAVKKTKKPATDLYTFKPVSAGCVTEKPPQQHSDPHNPDVWLILTVVLGIATLILLTTVFFYIRARCSSRSQTTTGEQLDNSLCTPLNVQLSSDRVPETTGNVTSEVLGKFGKQCP